MSKEPCQESEISVKQLEILKSRLGQLGDVMQFMENLLKGAGQRYSCLPILSSFLKTSRKKKSKKTRSLSTLVKPVLELSPGLSLPLAFPTSKQLI
jgi:hypothetical protein